MVAILLYNHKAVPQDTVTATAISFGTANIDKRVTTGALERITGDPELVSGVGYGEMQPEWIGTN